MTVFDVLTLVLGISLFLFGMNFMGETLKKSAGRKLKTFLGKLTSHPWKGFLLGALVTAIIQSSSATTVMVVGFVNSGTMRLSQAIGVIMGANVGTAVTSWITALSGLENGGAISSVLQWFKPSSFTPILALLGLLLYMAGKNEKKKNIGMILLGFSVLMIGMDTMSDAVSGLSQNETFRSILLMFENPLLGLLAGLLLTAIIQSSSASIGILQSFTVTGAITFGNAVPIIMGQNVGTCVTALIASAGANKNAKRASVVHLLFNVIGSGLCLGIFYVLKYVTNWWILDGRIDMWGIAIVHTLFNLLTFLALFPFSNLLERLAVALVRNKKGDEDRFSLLDERLLATPSVAIDRSREMTCRMATLSTLALEEACDLFTAFSQDHAQKVRQKEIVADEYEDRLGTYLLRISEQTVLIGEEREITQLLHMLGDWERISDHAVNLAESAEEISEKQITFSKQAWEELSVLFSAVQEISALARQCVQDVDLACAEQVEPLEQVIDELRGEIKRRHIIRLQQNECTMEQGFVLNDILTDLERVADHCSNVAGCMLELSQDHAMDMHQYLKEYREDRARFENRRNQYAEKYRLREDFLEGT